MSINAKDSEYYNNSEFVSNSSYDYRDMMDEEVAFFSERSLASLIATYDEMPATAGTGVERSAWLFEIIEASNPLAKKVVETKK